MTPILFLLTITAGGVGSVLRYLTDTAVSARLGADRPWGIAVANIAGSFALGVLTGLAARAPGLSPMLTVLGVGLMGGYTTFSTAIVDTVQLALARRHRAALANGLAHLVACILAAGLGLGVGHLGP